MPGVQPQAPQGSKRSLQPERRRDKATRRYGNHRDTKRLWTACKTHDSGPRCVKQESPGFSRGEVQIAVFRRRIPMAEKQSQTFANHARFDPPFHFFILPVFAAALIWAVVRFFTHLSQRSPWGNFRAFLIVVLAAAAATFVLKARMYSLKVQDRVIRLEERMRLMQLLPEPLRSRIP